jgi:hypothetical protein
MMQIRITLVRILLDAKDLINVVERSKPVKLEELDAWLRTRGSSVVYSLCNVRGLAGPIGIDPVHIPRIKTYLDELEELPHCYISAYIDLMELRSAVRCFKADTEYRPIDPYVLRFDQVFPPFADAARETYQFSDVVHDLWRACPHIFEPQPKAHKLQALAMATDRQKPRIKGSALAKSPSDPIYETLVSKLSVTPEQATEIVKWVSTKPSRCPGLWLIRAVGAAMSQDRSYRARKDDIFDMAEMITIPYAEAATVDRTTLHYFSVASRSLKQFGAAGAHIPKVFRNLAELMEALG